MNAIPPNNPPHDPADMKTRRLRNRNIGLFVALLAFVLLIYGVTIVKIKMGYGP